ncbi:hypothetical protein KBD49_14800 [Myxococcota bacterium]|nr:hypothetical protein [Myxococcota bacterium]
MVLHRSMHQGRPEAESRQGPAPGRTTERAVVGLPSYRALPAYPASDEDETGSGWRLDPRRAGLTATLDGEERPLGVLRVDPRGVDLAAPEEGPRPGRTYREMRLAWDRRLLDPVSVEVRPASPLAPLPRFRSGGARLAARFQDRPSLSFSRDLHVLLEELRRRGCLAPALATPPVVESVTDPDRVRGVLGALLAEGGTGTLLPFRGPPVPVVLDAVRPGDRRPVRLRLLGSLPTRPRVLRLQGHASVYEVPVSDPRMDGDCLAMAVPDRLRRLRHRESRRVAAPEGWEVFFRHPHYPQIAVRRPLRDVSVHGLSFRTHPAADLLIPGLALVEVLVTRDGEPRAALPARVRRMSAIDGGTGMVAGIRMEPETEAEARAWQEVAQEVMNPAVRTRGTPPDHTWNLFQDSGYFSLSGCSPEDFARKRRDFASAVARMDQAPDLGCQAVLPSSRGAECTFTIHRLYGGTYFPGQLAKRKGAVDGLSSREVLRAVHLAMYEHVQHDPDLRWFLVFLHESTRWTQMAYRDFPKRYIARGDAWQHPFDAWTGSTAEGPPVPPGTGGLVVRPLAPSERPLLARAAEASRCAAYVDVLELDERRLGQEDLIRRWARAGLLREREVRVACLDGVPLAASLLECGEPGAHLFGMYDTVRLFELAPGGARHYGDLLADARGWYRSRGLPSFVYLREDQDPDHARAAGLNFLGGAILLLMSRRILPEFLECVREVTASNTLTPEGTRHAEAIQAA